MINIFCDMDSVLVDLQTGYERLTGMTMQGADRFHNWDKEAFWALPKQDERFWIDLPKMPRAHILLEFLDNIRSRGANVFLLSAGVRGYEKCSIHKRMWVRSHTNIPVEFVHVVRRSEKAMFAVSDGKPNILIDDYHVNVLEWHNAGGVGLLYEEETIYNTIEQVEKYMFAFSNGV